MNSTIDLNDYFILSDRLDKRDSLLLKNVISAKNESRIKIFNYIPVC